MPGKGRSEVGTRRVRMWAIKGARYQSLVTRINDPIAVHGNLRKGHSIEGNRRDDGETK